MKWQLLRAGLLSVAQIYDVNVLLATWYKRYIPPPPTHTRTHTHTHACTHAHNTHTHAHKHTNTHTQTAHASTALDVFSCKASQ